MSEHTPGPWNQAKKNGRVIEAGGRKIATAAALMPNPQQAWGNAKLIAAAPELLKALQDLYNGMDSCVELTPEVMLAAREAIAKATE